MRTTIDLPDETFRQLKARAALNGLKLKDLVTQLVERGLTTHQWPAAAGESSAMGAASNAVTRFDNAPWLETTRRYVKPDMTHDLHDIHAAVAQGWMEAAARKCRGSQADD
jgi:hypothetical protein